MWIGISESVAVPRELSQTVASQGGRASPVIGTRQRFGTWTDLPIVWGFSRLPLSEAIYCIGGVRRIHLVPLPMQGSSMTCCSLQQSY